MGNIKVFLDHLFFSLIAVWVLLIIGYFGLAVTSGGWFDPWIAAGLWIGSSLVLAGYFTYKSIKNRPSDTIVYTRREL